MRRTYGLGELLEDQMASDPIQQFETWLQQAREAGLAEPNAMVLATADRDGRPSARTVLLKRVDERGFVFYTNQQSRKADDLSGNPHCALVFPWHAMERQVRVEGSATKLPGDEVDAYFASRPRESQLGAWASARQSAVVSSRESLDDAYAAVRARFADAEVPPPPFWGGYRVRPETVEFWQGRLARMHDRLRYRRVAVGDPPWLIERLSP